MYSSLSDTHTTSLFSCLLNHYAIIDMSRFGFNCPYKFFFLFFFSSIIHKHDQAEPNHLYDSCFKIRCMQRIFRGLNGQVYIKDYYPWELCHCYTQHCNSVIQDSIRSSYPHHHEVESKVIRRTLQTNINHLLYNQILLNKLLLTTPV